MNIYKQENFTKIVIFSLKMKKKEYIDVCRLKPNFDLLII